MPEYKKPSLGTNAYRNAIKDPEARKRYEEGWERIFGNKKKKNGKSKN